MISLMHLGTLDTNVEGIEREKGHVRAPSLLVEDQEEFIILRPSTMLIVETSTMMTCDYIQVHQFARIVYCVNQ